MKTKQTLETGLVILALAMSATVAHSQAYKGLFGTKLVLAGNQDNTTNTLTMIAGASSAPLILTWPATAGGTGNLLATDGSGNLSWNSVLSILGDSTAGHLLVANGSSWISRALSGDATLSSTGVLTLKNSGVTAAQYGNATNIAQVTFDAQGRATSAQNVAITGLAAGAINLADSSILVGNSSGVATAVPLTGDATISHAGVMSLVASGVTAGSYGDATHVGAFTVDAKGRLTSAGSVQITGAAPTGAAGGDLGGNFPNPTVVAVQTSAGSSIATAINTNSSNAINGENIKHDATLAVDGSHQLGINLANANIWSGRQTFGAVALSQAANLDLAVGVNNDVAVSTAYTYIRLTATSGVARLTSINNPITGRMIVIVNTDATNTITIVDEAATGTDVNRFHTSVGNIILMPSGTASFVYDGSRWHYLDN